MNTVEEVREAVVAAHAATTRLTTLVGPLWHMTRPLNVRVDDEMVQRAADAMHAAYRPDDGDDPAECWRDAMRTALIAAFGPATKGAKCPACGAQGEWCPHG